MDANIDDCVREDFKSTFNTWVLAGWNQLEEGLRVNDFIDDWSTEVIKLKFSRYGVVEVVERQEGRLSGVLDCVMQVLEGLRADHD